MEESVCELCNGNRVVSIIKPYSMPPRRLTSPCECATIRRFLDLPLGTRFQYLNVYEQWVIIDRCNEGTVVSWEGVDGPISGQRTCSAVETVKELERLKVIVVC